MQTEKTFEELKKLIDYIQRIYTEVTKEWQQCCTTNYNFKKLCVCDIEENGSIYQNIIGYIQILNGKGTDIALALMSVCTCKVVARVKTQNSTEYKIQNYKTHQHEDGKIPINKCINDLFGIRVIVEPAVNLDEIQEFVLAEYRGKYRCIDSSKLDYKAIHIYFKKNNQSFPWELQIWKEKDEENNLASHKKYKQAYTLWEKENKEDRGY